MFTLLELTENEFPDVAIWALKPLSDMLIKEARSRIYKARSHEDC